MHTPFSERRSRWTCLLRGFGFDDARLRAKDVIAIKVRTPAGITRARGGTCKAAARHDEDCHEARALLECPNGDFWSDFISCLQNLTTISNLDICFSSWCSGLLLVNHDTHTSQVYFFVNLPACSRRRQGEWSCFETDNDRFSIDCVHNRSSTPSVSQCRLGYPRYPILLPRRLAIGVP